MLPQGGLDPWAFRGVGQASAHPGRCHQGRCALLAVRRALPAATGPKLAFALRIGAECAGRAAPAGASRGAGSTRRMRAAAGRCV
jgi:hypothetical protein